jgi:hypothetical protein
LAEIDANETVLKLIHHLVRDFIQASSETPLHAGIFNEPA